MNTLAIIAAMTFGQLGIVPEVVAKQPEIRVLVFGAEWCGPCRQLHAEIERELFKPGMNWQRYISYIDIESNAAEISYASKNKQGGRDVPQVVITEDGIVVCRLFDVISTARLSSVANAIVATRKAK